MIKILTIGLLLYALYRLFFGPPILDTPQIRKGSKGRLQERKNQGEFIDYEEVD